MGTEKAIADLPVGAFIVNYYDDADDAENDGWQVAQITGERPEQLFVQGAEYGTDYDLDRWSSIAPIWNFAIHEGHPAHELLCAIVAAVALGGKPDELVARARELCNKELRNDR